MKRAWTVVLAIAFIAILMGAVAIGVGYLTGADLVQVYETLLDSQVAYFIRSLAALWNKGYALAQEYAAQLPALLQSIFG